MFDIGFFELAVLGLVLLYVVGPENLPSFLKKCGRFVQILKNAWSDADKEVKKVMYPPSDMRLLFNKNRQQKTVSEEENE